MARSLPPLELWAGVECTYNRVRDTRRDQLVLTGHRDRLEDIDAMASLRFAAVRYPVLWEHVYGADGARADWSWHDERLARMRELGVRPIVGLLHHGAGPGDAGFGDPRFAERFAAFAREVAERYPWVEDYIPINEPLTTARFCGLYAVWHPHARDDRVFARILVAQLEATVRAVRAIREVVPAARFIQNEDIGTIRSVPRLRYQASFENERRWVTFDLLCGSLTPGMRMWQKLLKAGISERELWWFAENAVPPDIVGVDNYITSDRFLDDRVERYPEWSHGGNGRDRYADIEAVRVVGADVFPGILPVLREAWDRYGRPLALAEWHIGCTREEQMRWLRDGWTAAEIARAEGIDVRALTMWSLFGSRDWNTLVTQDNGYYEPGPFDVRGGRPRLTALGTMARALATDTPFDHPVLDGDGWWRRDTRLTYPRAIIDTTTRYAEPALPRSHVDARPLAITGEPGAMLDALALVADVRGLERYEVPSEEGVSEGTLRRLCAWAVIDVATCARAGGPVADPVSHRASAVARTREAAMACATAGIPFVLVSCWHADRDRGRCAAVARSRERAARSVSDRVLIVRPGALFGPWHGDDPLVAMLAGQRSASLEDEQVVLPAYVPDVANAALDLLVDAEAGVWRLHHGTETTWAELAAAVRTLADGEVPDGPLGVARPDADGWYPLPTLTDAVSRFVRESESLWRRVTGPEPAPVIEADSAPGFEYPASQPAATLTRAAEAG